MNSTSTKQPTVLDQLFSIVGGLLSWLAAFYIIGLWAWGWVLLFGKRETRSAVFDPICTVLIGFATTLGLLVTIVVYAAVFGASAPVPNGPVMLGFIALPWVLFCFRLLAEGLPEPVKAPVKVDPTDKPLFEKNIFVTTATTRKSVATTFFLCAIPLMIAGACVGDEIYFGFCYKMVLSMSAFLFLRWALPFVMRRSSAGVHTHASWVLAILLWPVYATAISKLGVPGAIFVSCQNILSSLISGS